LRKISEILMPDETRSEQITNGQEASQDGRPKQLEAIGATRRKGKARSSRKAPAIKTSVIVKRLQGQDKTSISRELGIARNTVTAILEENDVERIMQDGQSQTLRRVPAALDVLDVRLEKNSENAALWLLDKCFDGVKAGRAQDPGLTLAIQNLMLGPTQVNNASTLHQNAAEPGTSAKQENTQATDSKQDKP
jgi:hypothetical protein